MQFRLFGIPVHVSSAFWLIALLLAARQSSMGLVVATMGVVFLAVLVHELGHALAAKAFGAHPGILLHSFGGTTSIQGVRLPRGRNIVVTAAGPFAGFVLGGLIVGAAKLAGPLTPFWSILYDQALFVTFGWGLLNLMPVLPMDGGLLLRDILGPRFRTVAYVISGLVGLALAVYCLKAKLIFGTVIFAMGTYHSIRGLFTQERQEEEENARTTEAREQLVLAARALEADRFDEVRGRASVVLQIAAVAELRDDARRLMAWASIQEEQPADAMESLRSIERPAVEDDLLRAQALDLAGQREAGFALLRKRTYEAPDGPTLEPLLRGLSLVGNFSEISDLSRELGAVGQPAALQFAADALHEQGLFDDAGGLRALLFDRTGDWTMAAAAARSFARAGKAQRALSLLEALAQRSRAAFVEAAASADLDSLRQDPRFLAMENRVALAFRYRLPQSHPGFPVRAARPSSGGFGPVHTAPVRRVAPSVVVYGAPLVGALYMAAHTVVAALVASRDRTIQGIEAADLTRAIQTRFSADILATGQLLLGTAVLAGLALGVAGGLLVSLRSHVRRKPPTIAEVVGAVVALHLALASASLVHRPQLYATFLYDSGGVRRLLSVLFTDVLGAAGTFVSWAIVFALFVWGWPAGRDTRLRVGRFVRLMKRNLVALAALIAIGLLAAIFPSTRSKRTEDRARPNVLVLAADSLRPDRIDDARAPTLAKFARESVVFDRVHVTIARTFPSWVTILTGRYPHEHGIRTMFPTRRARSRDFDALPQRFTQAGYHSFVASDFAGDIFPRIRLGFERVDCPTFHFGEVIRQRGIEAQPALLPFLDSRIGRALVPTMRELNRAADADDVARRTIEAIDGRGDRPFFGVAFFSTTHFPYAAPNPGYRAFTDSAYRGRFKYEKVNRLGRDAAPDAADIRQIRGLYDGAVRVVDDGMRTVLRALEARGLDRNTIVVVMADHGEDLFEGERGHGHGDHLFGEESAHVPLMIRDGRQDVRAARHVAGLARDVDLAPTLFDLAKLQAPADLSGRSLAPALSGAALDEVPAFAETGVWFTQDVPGVPAAMRLPYPDIPFLTEVLRGQGEDIVLRDSYEPTVVMAKHRSMVRGDHKLVLAPTRAGLRAMLFDLARDPECLHDRAAEDPERTATMRAELLAWVLEDKRLELRGDFLLPRPKAFGADAADSTVVRFDGP